MPHRALNVLVNDLPVILLFQDPIDTREIFVTRDQLTGIPTSVAIRGDCGDLVDISFYQTVPAPAPAPAGSFLRSFVGTVDDVTYQVTLTGEGRRMSGNVETRR